MLVGAFAAVAGRVFHRSVVAGLSWRWSAACCSRLCSLSASTYFAAIPIIIGISLNLLASG